MSVSRREDREWRGGVEELGQRRHGRELDRQVNPAPPFFDQCEIQDLQVCSPQH